VWAVVRGTCPIGVTVKGVLRDGDFATGRIENLGRVINERTPGVVETGAEALA
jgi:hypothetical protein